MTFGRTEVCPPTDVSDRPYDRPKDLIITQAVSAIAELLAYNKCYITNINAPTLTEMMFKMNCINVTTFT